MAAGAKFEGTTGADGKIQHDLPIEAQTASLTVFDDRPEGAQLKYRIQLAELPPADTVKGVKTRLQNLGYYWGVADDTLERVHAEAQRWPARERRQ